MSGLPGQVVDFLLLLLLLLSEIRGVVGRSCSASGRVRRGELGVRGGLEGVAASLAAGRKMMRVVVRRCGGAGSSSSRTVSIAR